MGILDEVLQLKKRGVSDKEIIFEMQQRGISPKEIEDSLQQARIKNAVIQETNSFKPRENENPLLQSLSEESSNESLTRNIGGEQYYSSGTYPEERPVPEQSQEYSREQNYYAPTQEYEQYPQDQYSNQYPGQGEYQQEIYEPSTGLDSETITEIAEQITQEKISEIKKYLEEMNEFRNISKAKLENMENRLHRIEQVIDKLQLSILEKVGSYLGNVEHVKKEMAMMRDSFEKVLSDENLEKLEKISHPHQHYENKEHKEERSPLKKENKGKTTHIIHHKASKKKK